MARKTITGLSPAAEQIVQERMTLIAAARLERSMLTELNRAWQDITNANGETGATASAVAEHGARVEAILGQHWRNIWDSFGRRMESAARKHLGQPMETKRAVPLTPQFDEARQRWINLFGALKVTQITKTTQEQAMRIINQAIADAVADGLSEIDAAALLRARMRQAGATLPRLRSRVIARTEAHNASAAATQAAAELSEVPMKREWVASQGERTRSFDNGAEFSHEAVNGQIVGMHEPFIVPGENGDEQLMYPGDANGSAANIINCRCAVAYIPD